jgi:hypothetical protein
MGNIFEALRELAEKEEEEIRAQINAGQAPSCPINPCLHPDVLESKTLDDFEGDCVGAIKMVISGLREGSNGNGMYKKTVIHAVAIKPIGKKVNRNWLKRQPRELLCIAPRNQRKGFGVAGRAGEEITCKQCKNLIERYQLNLCCDEELNRLIDCY